MGSNHQGRLWEGGGTLAGPQSWGWEDISVCENGAEHGCSWYRKKEASSLECTFFGANNIYVSLIMYKNES